MKNEKRVNHHVKIWYALGRIAPFCALFVLCVALFFDLKTWMEFLLCGIGLTFASFAFIWWWWVLDTVKQLFDMLGKAHEKFDEVIDDLSTLKKDINDSPRKRKKPTKPKS